MVVLVLVGVETLPVSRALAPVVQSKLYRHLRRHYQEGQLDWTIESVDKEFSACTAGYDGKLPVWSHAIIL